jgi:hypothetical protein
MTRRAAIPPTCSKSGKGVSRPDARARKLHNEMHNGDLSGDRQNGGRYNYLGPNKNCMYATRFGFFRGLEKPVS